MDKKTWLQCVRVVMKVQGYKPWVCQGWYEDVTWVCPGSDEDWRHDLNVSEYRKTWLECVRIESIDMDMPWVCQCGYEDMTWVCQSIYEDMA